MSEFVAVPPARPEIGKCWVVEIPVPWEPKDVLLLEDGRWSGLPHSLHDDIRQHGGGRFWYGENHLYFSASDNSNPNSNGRRYLLTRHAVSEPASQRHIAPQLWHLHKDGAYFVRRGGHLLAPPRHCNLSLTNKCNLRCEMCGSQKLLDITGTPRRHMDKALMEAVAETLFPFMVHVELNSQGDPLLYPYIERVLELMAEHRCRYTIQTNGTLFSDRIIRLLMESQGMLSLSLDAVGPRLDVVRRGADWSRAEPQLLKLFHERDRERHAIWLYPTVTERTVQDMAAVVAWADQVGADGVVFHGYNPVEGSAEQTAADEAIRAQLDLIRERLVATASATEVRWLGEVIHAGRPSQARYHAPYKDHLQVTASNFPREAGEQGSDPDYLCAAPIQYVEIGLDGQISVCCRTQSVPIGFATSKEAFADAWFGHGYRRIRDSLRRDASGALTVPGCVACIREFTPRQPERPAVAYDADGSDDSRAYLFRDPEVALVDLRKERGHCATAILPLGLEASRYELLEDGVRLEGAGALHDEIRELGGGRHSFWNGTLFFSASDNTDPLRNGRTYHLRRIEDDPVIVLSDPRAEGGFCHVFRLPFAPLPGEYRLFEDDEQMGPAEAVHDDIRRMGAGRYSIWARNLYFSASDNSDPATNGRTYRLVRHDQPAPVLAKAAERDGGAEADLVRRVEAADRISMLGSSALLELAKLSSRVLGPIIELGPYVGGSTCALAAPDHARVVTVEIGGPNPNHPQLPTEDTIADLRRNLARAGVADRVEIVEGHFREASVLDAVRGQLGGRKARLLFVDLLPGSDLAVQLYTDLLDPDGYLVIDDYVFDQAVEKARQVRSFVEAAKQAGFVEEIGVFGWGTWFGKVTGQAGLDGLRSIPAWLPAEPEVGHAWSIFVGHASLADDVTAFQSPLELLEDGLPLGPAHSIHAEIRTKGAGRYSHWGDRLWFSTPDGTSPLDNGRRYAIRLGDTMMNLVAPRAFPAREPARLVYPDTAPAIG